ncbi:MAG: imidazoleglycerol-phosphate dehydratase HisB [Pseudomonadota bacterium]
MERKAKIERKTSETNIKLDLNIDGSGICGVETSVPFLDHMLSLMAKHGFFDLTIKAKGDTSVDFHHTVEDVGICLGEGFKQALGKKDGIVRYGEASVPMVEAMASVVLDICDRPFLVYNNKLKKGKTGEFDTELIWEFFRAFSSSAGITLHINVMYGKDTHHTIEAVFKAFGRALDKATSIDKRIEGVMSTKGKL